MTLSGFLGRSGRAGGRATLFAAGFCLFGLLGAPGVIYGTASGQSGGQRAVALVPGTDSESTCATFPCATVSSTGSGSARISLGLGVDSDDVLQPMTYYTDLLMITNPTGATVSVTSVALSGVSAASPADFGSITLYYCPTQTNAPQTGCAGSFTATSQAGGSAFQGSDQLAPGAVRYIELSGFAGPGSHPGDTMAFTIEVTAG